MSNKDKFILTNDEYMTKYNLDEARARLTNL